MTDDALSRRTLLKTSGIALAGLAGCTGSPSSSSTEQASTPTSTSTSHEEEGHEEGGHEDDGHEEEGHEEDGHGHDEAIGEPVDHATVTMVTNDSGTHFEPHVVRVNPGGAVTWELESGTHTTTACHPDTDRPLRMPDDATPWDSGMLSEQGATFEHTFETEGVYDYVCVPHEATGMLGSIIVGEPDAHDQPGLAEPQDSLPDAAQTKIEDLNTMVNEALGHTHDEETTESGDHNEG
ncbi:plastocyanin/azurin family copper-binding protein [Haloarculaceae archaeon H-GB11]|nr:plastocyanin/azurin family copper-binding protein [Haloarculaceae archaeon H-GB11]